MVATRITTKVVESGLTVVMVNGVEIGWVKRSGQGGWRFAATQRGNYAHLSGIRTKAAAIAALARTAH